MRNLKLKQVLPVDTESETLQKFSQASNGHLNASGSADPDASTARPLHSVKETPGLHVMGDLYDVQCDADFMVNADRLRSHCLKLVEEAGLTSVGDFFHQFDGGGGVTGMVPNRTCPFIPGPRSDTSPSMSMFAATRKTIVRVRANSIKRCSTASYRRARTRTR